MRSAIPVCGQDIALVFDDADCLLLIETGEADLRNEVRLNCAGNTMIDRANQLRSLGVNLLICGAISCPLQRMIEASGIEIIPFMRGNAAEVFDAYSRNRLADRRFLLPGRRLLLHQRLGRGRQERSRCKKAGKSQE